MEKSAELETKYQKLATEYSKLRSKATVLKKAVLDEQAKSLQLTEIIKTHEQTIRKHDQEMESLTFRNEQLTKRIAVLQQELLDHGHGKKHKGKSAEFTIHADTSVLDQELQKKIFENAELVSTLTDKEYELTEVTQKVEWLNGVVASLQRDLEQSHTEHMGELERYKKEYMKLERKLDDSSDSSLIQIREIDSCNENETSLSGDKDKCWRDEVERWKSECEMLRSKPSCNEKLTEYYECHIRDILEEKRVAVSETKTLWAENMALKLRLEHLVTEHKKIQSNLETSHEELLTTNDNYKSQLDALTEHLAAQNEKITKQCDEIQVLKYKLSMKK